MASNDYERTFWKNLATLRDNQPDTILIAGTDEQKIPAHRIILMAASDFFRTLLTLKFCEATENEVKLDFVSGSTLIRILDFIYSGQIEIDITDENVGDLIAAASIMKFIALEKRCEAYFEVKRVSLLKRAGVASSSNKTVIGSANAWKPKFLNVSAVGDGDPNNIEVLCKKVRGILNKLTTEKFDPLMEQLQALNINNSENMSKVISLVFEKAIDEPKFSSAYAALCKKLSEPIQEENEGKRCEEGNNAGAQEQSGVSQPDFKKEMLNKCQKEFDNHVANENSMRQKLTPLENEINETTDQNRKMELRAQLDEEERKLRRQSVGTVRFIGELYRQGMLITSIMESCITALLNIRTDEKLECLCKLLTTVGKNMEQKTPVEAWNSKYYRDLTPHFKEMQAIASDKKSTKISSRVRIMMLDVIELRRNKWVPRRNDSNLKTMDHMEDEEVRSDAVFRFRVENFLKLKEWVQSPPCYVRNLPWKIMVRQRNQAETRSMGFYSQCNADSESSSWSCNAKAELRLLSFKPDQEPFVKEIEHLFCSKENDWGFANFMAGNDFTDPEKGYIQDDAVLLEVYVIAEAPYGVL